MAKREIVAVYLSGGSSDNLRPSYTLWVDLDRGNDSRGDWAVLTTPEHVDAIVADSGAVLGGVEVWAGEAFGDGNCGTVELSGTKILHPSTRPTYVPAGYSLERV